MGIIDFCLLTKDKLIFGGRKREAQEAFYYFPDENDDDYGWWNRWLSFYFGGQKSDDDASSQITYNEAICNGPEWRLVDFWLYIFCLHFFCGEVDSIHYLFLFFILLRNIRLQIIISKGACHAIIGYLFWRRSFFFFGEESVR